jgi:hypothetical protein
MANIYSFFDNGTWESTGAGVESVFESGTTPAPVGTTLLAELQRSTTLAMTGAASGRLTFKAQKTNNAVYCPNLFVNLVGYVSAPRPTLSIFSGQAGKEFIMRCKIRTPSTNPIGSPDLLLRMAPMVAPFNSPVVVTLSPILITKKTVAEFTDAWAELEYRFIVQDNNSFYISLVADDSSLRVDDLPAGIAWDYAGTLNVNGVIYFDDITIEEVITCDLALGVPTHTKTDETGVGANDGTITVNATSSFTRQYRIDGGAWQNPNLFSGVAPGVHSIEVQDLNGCTLPAFNVSILEFVPPECDVIISNVNVTDETGVGLNDGTATIIATSGDVLEYAVDAGAYQAGTLFAGIAPGVHTARVRKVGGTCPVTQLFSIAAFNVPPVAAPLSVNQRPVNSYNFISWFQATGKINFSSLQFTNCNWDLPKAYRSNKVHGKHYPVAVNDEQFTFYINFDEDYNYPGFSSLRLDLVNEYGLVQQNVAPLSQVFQADGVNYFIYASVILSGKNPGLYRLAITDTSTAAPHNVLFITQQIQIMTAASAPIYTARFRFRASVSMYRFLYSSLPLEFFQEIRLRVSVMEEDIDGEVAQYRAVSSGLLRNVSSDLDKFINLEMYWFDDLANRAMFVFQAHDFITLNDVWYIVKELYKIQWDAASNINKGTIQLFEQEFSAINRYGDPSQIIVTDPVLGSDNGNVIGV